MKEEKIILFLRFKKLLSKKFFFKINTKISADEYFCTNLVLIKHIKL